MLVFQKMLYFKHRKTATTSHTGILKMTYKEINAAHAAKQIDDQEYGRLYAKLDPKSLYRAGHCTVSNCAVEDKPLPLRVRG